MAHPASEIITMLGRMNALLEFLRDLPEIIFCGYRITLMTVKTGNVHLHSQIAWMWEGSRIFSIVAIGAFKIPVIGPVKIRRVNDIIRIHALLYRFIKSRVKIIIFALPMTGKTNMILAGICESDVFLGVTLW
jgi:hypothetical protein